MHLITGILSTIMWVVVAIITFIATFFTLFGDILIVAGLIGFIVWIICKKLK